MKGQRSTIVLLVLFFAGLGALWWADTAKIPTAQQRREMFNRVLPELIDSRLTDLRRLEIAREKEPALVFERRDANRWQMLEPVDTAADPSMVENLVRELKELRKSPDAGTISRPGSSYGLAPPEATIRVFAAGSRTPLAALEIGKGAGDRRYVRPLGEPGIEVVEARTLALVDVAPPGWRDKAVFALPTFGVGSLEATGPGRDVKLERVEGHWMVARPFRAPAEEVKVEGELVHLTSLRVLDGDNGFVADNVRDFKPYGLDPPALKVELKPVTGAGKAQILLVGKAVPGRSDTVYARRGDQDDVILVDGKGLRDLGLAPTAFRSKKVAEIDPARADFVRVRAFDRDFTLARTSAGWDLLRPSRVQADTPSVQSLLARINEVQASELLDPEKILKPGLDPPEMMLKIWQPEAGAPSVTSPAGEPRGEPRASLEFGRHDPIRKTVYARMEGDRTILALPDSILDVLPKNTLAFRERLVLALHPGEVRRLSVVRGGARYVLETAGPEGKPNAWRMLEPVQAPADVGSVTSLLMMLSRLRAEGLISEDLGDGKAYGLNEPAIRVSWTGASGPAKAGEKGESGAPAGSLEIASQGPSADLRFAVVGGRPPVFTLSTAAIQPLLAEFHERRVLAFPAEKVGRLTMRWPGRVLSFTRQPRPLGGPADWRPEPGVDTSGFDMSRLNALANQLAKLTTPRFVQYEGAFPVHAGLAHPRLVIQVQLGESLGSRELRVGGTGDDGLPYATAAPGDSGPVFSLAGPGWTDLLRFGSAADRSPELPHDVFAPTPPKAP